MNRSRKETADRLKLLEEHGQSIWPITQPIEFDLESDEHYDADMAARAGRDPSE
jgi:sulfite oxidase